MPDSNSGSCGIPPNDPVFARYHDEEWGVPAVDDQVFFEKVCLEGFQVGLSWKTILHRRNDLRHAFDNFDPDKIKRYSPERIKLLANDKKIIRNRRKIESVVNNAHRFFELKSEAGSVAAFFWSFEPLADKRPAKVTAQWLLDTPFTVESKALAISLKARGWSFVGPTTMYALMQALGLVNDHLHSCKRHGRVETLRNALDRPKLS